MVRCLSTGHLAQIHLPSRLEKNKWVKGAPTMLAAIRSFDRFGCQYIKVLLILIQLVKAAQHG